VFNGFIWPFFANGITKRKDLKEIIAFYPPDEQEAEDYFNNHLNKTLDKILSNKNIGKVKIRKSKKKRECSRRENNMVKVAVMAIILIMLFNH